MVNTRIGLQLHETFPEVTAARDLILQFADTKSHVSDMPVRYYDCTLTINVHTFHLIFLVDKFILRWENRNFT